MGSYNIENSLQNNVPPSSHIPLASILVISLTSSRVNDFLAQHIFSYEGFLREDARQNPSNNASLPLFSYRFSNIHLQTKTENFPLIPHIEQTALSLRDEIAAMPNLKALITLGITAHHTALRAYHLPIAHMGHLPGVLQTLPDGLLLTHARHIPESFIEHKTHLPERLRPLRQVLALLRTTLK